VIQLRCQLVKQEEEFGQSRVNNYYRGKNQESVQLYLQKIQEEDRKKREEQRKIKRYEKTLRNMGRTVSVKQQYLEQIET
jgi:hypothetical protein